MSCNYVNTGRGGLNGLELQSSWDWFRNGKFVTILGVDGRLRSIKTGSETLNVASGASLYPSPAGLDYSDFTEAAYGQQTWVAARTLRFSGGARVDSERRFSPVLSPRVAATWNPWTDGTLKGRTPGLSCPEPRREQQRDRAPHPSR